MNRSPLTRHHRRYLRFSSILGAITLACTASATPWIASAPASAAPRQELSCQQPDLGSLMCEQDRLEELIAQAGTTPTTISLGSVETMISSTIIIPSGADIEFINPEPAPWGPSDTGFNRENGFRGAMIRVEPGATLTLSVRPDGGSTYVTSRGQYVPADAPTILSRGTLVMNTGTSVKNARGMCSSKVAAVTVSGPQASFEMNGGAITNNERTRDGGGCQVGAGNLLITDGAHAIINDGEISKGYGGGSNSYHSVGGIGVFHGSTLELNGGKVTENSGFAGGIMATSNYLYASQESARRHATSQRNHITINGGEITNNNAAFMGGGVSIWDNSSVTMNDGTVSNNEAPNGGGVGTLDEYVWGSSATWAEIAGTGKDLGFTAEEWSDLVPAEFTMNGGEITNNFASRTGGGVNVISNKVTLKGGLIEGNEARQQGGGIYVATKTYTVHLENVLIDENEASYIGGGMWLCPTGHAEIHVTEGGALVNNSAQAFGDDVAHDTYGGTTSAPSTFDRRMLGFGDVGYYKDASPTDTARYDATNPGPEQVFEDVPADQQDPNKEYFTTLYSRGLKAVSSDEAKANAAAFALLRITHNTSLRGAGIGSNGGVVIGHEGTSIPVAKKWQDEQGSELSTGLPSSITVQLTATLEGKDGAEHTIDVGQPVEISPAADGTWTHLFTQLPVRIAENATYVAQEVRYGVRELAVEGFTTQISRASNGSLVVTNRKNPTPPPTIPPTTPPVTPPATPPTTPPSTPPTTPPPNRELPRTGITAAASLMSASALVAIGAILVARRKRAQH